MKINFRSFPHPVLSHFSDDFVGCAFQSTVDVVPSTTHYRLLVSNQLSDPTILGLISDQKASYSIHVECRPTKFRKMTRFYESEFGFDIETGKVDGEVEICCLIVAEADIERYESPNFHSDFNGYHFSVRKGDILAVAYDRRFFADKSLDSLKKIPSIFIVVADNAPNAKDLTFDYSREKIIVRLKAELYNQYRALRLNQSLHTTLAQMVIVPVLVEIVTDIKASDDRLDLEHGETRWHRALSKRAAELGFAFENKAFETESALTIAMKLIDDPMGKSFESLLNYEE